MQEKAQKLWHVLNHPQWNYYVCGDAKMADNVFEMWRSLNQIRPTKIRPSDICITKVCSRQVLTFERMTSEILTGEVCGHS